MQLGSMTSDDLQDIQAQSLAPAARQATTVTRADKRKLTDTMFAATQDDSVIDLCNDDDPVDLDICASNLAHGQLSGSSASGVRNRRKSKSQAGSNGQHHSHTAERTRVILPPATQASIAAVHRPSVGKLTHNTYTVQQIQQNVFLPSTKQQTKGRRRLLVQGQPHANNAGSEEEPTSSGHQRSTASLQLPPVQQSARQALDAARSSAQKDGCIDLLDATDAGVRALEAADRQVDTASNDTALATALAEKADLERKLKEALANTQASLSTRPLRAPIPSHWAPMPEETHVRYVELPLPPDCSPARAEQARLPGKPPLDEATLSAMISQGLNRQDAEAALRHCKGDGDAALLHAVQCIGQGGAAACADSLDAAPEQAIAQAAARQEADSQEVLQVLARFTATDFPVRHCNIVRIERVQNPHLWTKYCLRRHEIELAAGSAGTNEQLLFHGCRKDVVEVITKEGFDIRVAAMHGSLGAGTYFAGNSSYSMEYIDRGPQGLIAPGMIPMPGMPGMQNMQSMQGMPPWPVSFISSAPTGPVTRQRPNLLPHPSRHGVAIAAKKKKSKSHSRKVPQQDKTSGAPNHHDNKAQPGFLGDGKAMLVCRVSLGRLALGGSGLRRPPQGFDAVSGPGGTKFPQALHPSMQAIFAVYDNSQAYPEYIVHFRLHSSQ